LSARRGTHRPDERASAGATGAPGRASRGRSGLRTGPGELVSGGAAIFLLSPAPTTTRGTGGRSARPPVQTSAGKRSRGTGVRGAGLSLRGNCAFLLSAGLRPPGSGAGNRLPVFGAGQDTGGGWRCCVSGLSNSRDDPRHACLG